MILIHFWLSTTCTVFCTIEGIRGRHDWFSSRESLFLSVYHFLIIYSFFPSFIFLASNTSTPTHEQVAERKHVDTKQTNGVGSSVVVRFARRFICAGKKRRQDDINWCMPKKLNPIGLAVFEIAVSGEILPIFWKKLYCSLLLFWSVSLHQFFFFFFFGSLLSISKCIKLSLLVQNSSAVNVQSGSVRLPSKCSPTVNNRPSGKRSTAATLHKGLWRGFFPFFFFFSSPFWFPLASHREAHWIRFCGTFAHSS